MFTKPQELDIQPNSLIKIKEFKDLLNTYQQNCQQIQKYITFLCNDYLVKYFNIPHVSFERISYSCFVVKIYNSASGIFDFENNTIYLYDVHKNQSKFYAKAQEEIIKIKSHIISLQFKLKECKKTIPKGSLHMYIQIIKQMLKEHDVKCFKNFQQYTQDILQQIQSLNEEINELNQNKNTIESRFKSCFKQRLEVLNNLENKCNEQLIKVTYMNEHYFDNLLTLPTILDIIKVFDDKLPSFKFNTDCYEIVTEI